MAEVDNPVQECVAEDAEEEGGGGPGGIAVQVVSTREGDEESTPIADVGVRIAGHTRAPAQQTDGSGMASFDGLIPGNYSVLLNFSPQLRSLYDMGAGVSLSQMKAVAACATQAYLFEIPYVYVKFVVTYAGGDEPVAGIDYILRQRNGDYRSEGTMEGGEVYEKLVPSGRYVLEFKAVSEAEWDMRWQDIRLDEEINLQATVTGYDAETPGTLEIFDTHDLGNVLVSLEATVQELRNSRILRAAWTPTAENLSELTSGSVLFCARVESAKAFSPVARVMAKQTFEVKDKDGAGINTRLVLYFSGGHIENAATSGGEVEVSMPWGEKLCKISLPDQEGALITIEDGDLAGRKFLLP